LRGTPEALVKRLTDDPELIIVVRPSLVLHFQHLWTADRVQEGAGADKVREFCIDIFTGLYIWRDNSMCRDIVFGLVAQSVTNPDETRSVMRQLREPLTHGPVEPPAPQQDAIRQRTIDLIMRLLHSAKDGLRHIQTAYANVPFSDWPDTEQKNAQSLTQLIDYIGSEHDLEG
jgi:hypothetical protein